ncbi:MAG: hypothetical protein JSR72_23395 [Proteobacteria bacterium]|nr:hypothetical protein [Pseudomonadota bacterium]
MARAVNGMFMAQVEVLRGSCARLARKSPALLNLAALMLSEPRFTSDALLLGADAMAEAADEAVFANDLVLSAELRALADRLRAEAPQRAPRTAA